MEIAITLIIIFVIIVLFNMDEKLDEIKRQLNDIEENQNKETPK